MKRRDFGKLTAAGLFAGLLDKDAAAQTAASDESLTGGPKVTIGMLAYPGLFLQDLVGPLAMFESMMNRDIHLIWKNRDPLVLPGERPLIPVTATTTFKECPADLDVLFVPGGARGTLNVMNDDETLDFLAERGKTAKYVTSVCTGSLILGAAGLLKGYRATTYWLSREVLKEFGAIPTPGRVVTDRNRITGGGVTAGLDFGLTLVAKLRNRTYAEAVQLYLEYDPRPPFSAGSPETAPPVARKFISDMLGPFNVAARAAAERTRKRSA